MRVQGTVQDHQIGFLLFPLRQETTLSPKLDLVLAGGTQAKALGILRYLKHSNLIFLFYRI